jgi:hypothetical protein
MGSLIGRMPRIMNGGRPMKGGKRGRIPGGMGGKNLGGIIIIPRIMNLPPRIPRMKGRRRPPRPRMNVLSSSPSASLRRNYKKFFLQY